MEQQNNFTFEDALMFIVLFILIAGLFGLAIQGIRTGKMELRGGAVYRDQNPIAFWGFGIFYIVVAVGLLCFLLVGFL